ncbi:MAG: transcriptional repressor [Clostridiales bacterium]|jgi:Fur family ferric uptake transcriptional regulator|nr:transcriptional repressor [Clostridiales bacterium]
MKQRRLKTGYNTKQKESLLAFLKQHGGAHFTAEEIFIHFARLGEPVGQTTVYRNLEKLVNDGLVIKYDLQGNGGACFQYIGIDDKRNGHYHLVCASCGEIAHLECGFIDKLAEHIRDDHGFDFDGQKTVFYGRCSDCQKPEEL